MLSFATDSVESRQTVQPCSTSDVIPGCFSNTPRLVTSSGWPASKVAPKSVAVARDKGLGVTCGDIATLRVESKYDLVVLNDVLEHVADPLLVLQSVATILKPQGRLYLATPNAGALIYKVGETLFRMFGSMPLLEKLYVSYHEYYFSNRGLRTMVQAQSMTPVMHENREFPLDEFGHGRRLKVAVGGLFALQSVLRRPSLQILVAQKGLAG